MVDSTASFSDAFRLDGKVIVLTGAGGILGREYCRAMSELGATVYAADVAAERCEALAQEINGSVTGKIIPAPVDLADEASIVAWSHTILNRTPQVDVLINNAAAKAKGFFDSFESFSLQTWREVMAVNVDAVFLSCREIGSSMAQRGRGSIVNVASIYGVVGPDQRIYENSWYEELGGKINTPLIYSASKGAVVSMTRYLATYWGPRGVRTNCITPGGVSSGQNDEFNLRYSQRVPLGRMAHSREIVGAMVYLASDASSYVNGHNLVVDGGWTAW